MRTVKLWLAFGAAFMFVFFGVHMGGSSGVNGAKQTDAQARVMSDNRVSPVP